MATVPASSLRPVAALSLIGAVALGACDESAPRSAGEARTSTATPVHSAAGELTPEVRAAWHELVGRELPRRFTDGEEKRFYATCLEFTRALHDEAAALEAASAHQSRDPAEPPALLRAVEAVKKKPPPKMAAEDAAWCAAYTIKSLRAELGAQVARQAETTLQAMAGAMVAAYQRDGKLCPSTAEPVPPDVKTVTSGPYQPDVTAWDAPTWRCLRFRWLQPLRFQFELQTKGDAFEFIARGSPAADGRVDTYRLAGAVRGGEIEVGRATGRFLAPAETPEP
ncbi:MAG: hypothetical protein JRI23_33160 [Deltaproteobacteria bacterium]|nr:hypothetical protein [Deltaproteobacteria bacterium]MBW2537120.1 hypothetical protein [Deltaproteobacteria bacterium]